MSLDLEDITGAIIGAAIEVHRELGPGFLESVCEAALVVELSHRRIPFVRQHSVPVAYRGVEVGLHAAGRMHGLLLNFAKPTLEIKRVLGKQPPP